MTFPAAASPARHGSHPGRTAVSGLPIFDGGLDEAVAACLQAIDDGQGARVATVNLDFFALARSDGQLLSDLNHSTLLVADGMPVVWLGRLAGLQAIGRVTGVDLVAALCRAGGRRGPFRVALFGSEPELIDRASKTIEEFAPGVRAVFTVSPPFRAWTADEVERFRGGIASAEPDLVLVALGCPRQERLIAEWYPLAPRAVWIGVGGTFDFFAGRRRRAPRWMQRAGLEWSYRLVQDPRRLGRRYFGRDLPALARLTLSVLRERRRGGDSGSTELQR